MCLAKRRERTAEEKQHKQGSQDRAACIQLCAACVSWLYNKNHAIERREKDVLLVAFARGFPAFLLFSCRSHFKQPLAGQPPRTKFQSSSPQQYTRPIGKDSKYVGQEKAMRFLGARALVASNTHAIPSG